MTLLTTATSADAIDAVATNSRCNCTTARTSANGNGSPTPKYRGVAGLKNSEN